MKWGMEPCGDWKEPSQERGTANAKALTWNSFGWRSEKGRWGGGVGGGGEGDECRAGMGAPRGSCLGFVFTSYFEVLSNYKEDAKYTKSSHIPST